MYLWSTYVPVEYLSRGVKALSRVHVWCIGDMLVVASSIMSVQSGTTVVAAAARQAERDNQLVVVQDRRDVSSCGHNTEL